MQTVPKRMDTNTMNKEKPSLFGTMVCVRTSAGDHKPCKDAEEVSYVYVDRRTVDDPVKLPPWSNDNWYKRGRNHRVENGMIARDMDSRTRWVVRIPDGAALQAFIEKYGQVVISSNDEGVEPCYQIEIYDDYKE